MINVFKDFELIPFNTEHLNDPIYLSWLNDKKVIKFLGRPEYFKDVSIDNINEYYESVRKNQYIHFFAVYYLPENKFIGTAKILLLDSYNGIYDIGDVGIMIGDTSFWGKGFSHLILAKLCIYAIKILKVRKLTAGAISENIAVVKSFKKIGFKVEGVLRQKIQINSEYFDHILLGCFTEEFSFHL